MEKTCKKSCTKINLYEVTNLPYVLWKEFSPWERSNRQVSKTISTREV